MRVGIDALGVLEGVDRTMGVEDTIAVGVSVIIEEDDWVATVKVETDDFDGMIAAGVPAGACVLVEDAVELTGDDDPADDLVEAVVTGLSVEDLSD